MRNDNLLSSKDIIDQIKRPMQLAYGQTKDDKTKQMFYYPLENKVIIVVAGKQEYCFNCPELIREFDAIAMDYNAM